MSFFRTYIDKEIQKELFNRINSLNFQKSPQGLLDSVQSAVQHKFVKACWARATVVLGEKSIVSLNSNLDENNNPINEPLNIKDGNPYRGKPGITSISTSFKEYFMKQGTINFVVPDPNEFDIFKQQFLKFGRYMLVEFGWSLPYNLSLPSLEGDSVLKISKNLRERVRLGNGNYNAFVGVVTNYNFSQTKEGTYEGTIELSSMGRNILGQKSSTDGKVENLVNYINNKESKSQENQDGEENTDTKGDKNTQKNAKDKLEKSFINFNSVMEHLIDVVEYYSKVGKENPDDFIGFLIRDKKIYTKPGVFFLDDKVIFRESKLGWVTWGWFEDFILNSFFSFVSNTNVENEVFKTEFFSADSVSNTQTNRFDDGMVVEFSPNDFSDSLEEPISNFNNTNIECNSHPDLYSLGPMSVILPGKTKQFSPDEEFAGNEKQAFDETQRRLFLDLIKKIENHFPKFDVEGKKNERGQIRNMVFNVEYLRESFKFTNNIEQSINDFWQKVSNDYGGFWRFGVVEHDSIDGRIMVTDMNVGQIDDTKVVPDKLSKNTQPNPRYEIFEFPVYSKNSIVSDFTLQTANTSEMATLAVYGANVNLEESSADDGKGTTSLSLRALSMLENNSGDKLTLNDQQEDNYFDRVLQNITNPVLHNLRNSEINSFQGSSAEYDDDGKVKFRKRDSGINFYDIPEVLETSETIVRNLIEEENTIFTDESKFNATIKRAKTQIRTEGFFWFKPNDTNVQIYSTKTGTIFDSYKRTMLFNINKAPGDKSNYTKVPPIVPIQVSLTLQGIGGIKIGDLFYLRNLPKKYKEFCHFMVVNVEHEIGTNGWTTKLDSRMVIDIPLLLEKRQPTQLKELDIIVVKTNLEDAISEQVKKYGFKYEAPPQDADVSEFTKLTQANPNSFVQNPNVGEGPQT